MPVSEEPSVVSVDAAAMREAVESTVDGALRSFVEFDAEDYGVLYVDDLTMQFYGDEAAMEAHFDEIHSYVHADFTEKAFYTEDLFPISDRVRYIATGFDVFTVMRVYFGDEGVFVTVDRDEPVEPVVEAIESVWNEE